MGETDTSSHKQEMIAKRIKEGFSLCNLYYRRQLLGGKFHLRAEACLGVSQASREENPSTKIRCTKALRWQMIASLKNLKTVWPNNSRQVVVL